MNRALILSLALLTACAVDSDDPVATADIDFARHQDRQAPSPDGRALVGLAYATSDIESVVELDLFDVFNASPYPSHPGLASCLHLPLPEDIQWIESECPGVDGWGWEIELEDCRLGPADRTSGSVYISYETMNHLQPQAEQHDIENAMKAAQLVLEAGEQITWFDMQLAEDDAAEAVQVCGVQDGNMGDHATEFKARIPLRWADTLYAHWQGHGAAYLTEDRGKVFVRDGRLNARFEKEDGATRTLTVDVMENLRREYSLYPEDGWVRVVGQSTQLEYHPFTRYTGEVSVTERDGSVRTHHLAVPR